MAVKLIRVFLDPLGQLSCIFREHSSSSYGWALSVLRCLSLALSASLALAGGDGLVVEMV